MKKIQLLLCAVFLSTLAFSQVITSDTAVYSSFPKNNFPHSLYDTLINNTANTITVSWSKSSDQLLSGWTCMGMCDPLACYPVTDTSVHTISVAPGASAIFNVDMQAVPAAANGTSFVTLTTNYGDMVFKFQTAPQICSAGFYIYEDTLAAPHTYIGVNTSTGSIATYDWNWGDGTPNSSGPYPAHTYAAAGNYIICLTVSDGLSCVDSFCSNELINKTLVDMLSVTFYQPTSIQEQSEVSTLVYPNPAHNFLRIQGDNSMQYELAIFSLSGNRVYSASVNNSQVVDISALANGMYFLKLSTTSGPCSYQRFVKH